MMKKVNLKNLYVNIMLIIINNPMKLVSIKDFHQVFPTTV